MRDAAGTRFTEKDATGVGEAPSDARHFVNAHRLLTIFTTAFADPHAILRFLLTVKARPTFEYRNARHGRSHDPKQLAAWSRCFGPRVA